MSWRPPAAAAAAPPADRRARSLVTPEGLVLPVTLAPRGARAGALIIDVMIVTFGLFAFQLALLWIAGGLLSGTRFDPDAMSREAMEFLGIVSALFVFAVWYGYFLVQELGPRGATLGKRIVGIRIAARGGARLTPEAVIARNLLRDIEIFYPLVTLLVLRGLCLLRICRTCAIRRRFRVCTAMTTTAVSVHRLKRARVRPTPA